MYFDIFDQDCRSISTEVVLKTVPLEHTVCTIFRAMSRLIIAPIATQTDSLSIQGTPYFGFHPRN